MSIRDFSNVLKIFSGSDTTPEEQDELVREALVMTLSRAASADANISPCEVETARSELFETAPLEKYLSSVGRRIEDHERARIARALAEVIKSDVQVTSREVNFFNEMAEALGVSAAGLAGLTQDS